MNTIHSVNTCNHGENVTKDYQENVSSLVSYGVGKFFLSYTNEFFFVDFHTTCVLKV